MEKGKIKFKKCPFCGCFPLDFSIQMGIIYCRMCGAQAPKEIWNNRPTEEALKRKIKELEKR